MFSGFAIESKNACCSAKEEGGADCGRQCEDTWTERRKEEPPDAAEHGALMGSDPAPNSPPSFPSSGAEQKADFPFGDTEFLLLRASIS